MNINLKISSDVRFLTFFGIEIDHIDSNSSTSEQSFQSYYNINIIKYQIFYKYLQNINQIIIKYQQNINKISIKYQQYII
ncbi:hypothetical protein pb186bvf_011831 [Paramecium bursaria]